MIIWRFWEPNEEENEESLEIEEEEEETTTMVILSYDEKFDSFSEIVRLFHHYNKNDEEEEANSLGNYVCNQIKNVILRFEDEV